MPNLRELGFEVGSPPPLFWVRHVCFQLRLEHKALSLTKPSSWIGVENGPVYSIKRKTNLETKILEIGHMSRPNSFDLGFVS